MKKQRKKYGPIKRTRISSTYCIIEPFSRDMVKAAQSDGSIYTFHGKIINSATSLDEPTNISNLICKLLPAKDPIECYIPHWLPNSGALTGFFGSELKFRPGEILKITKDKGTSGYKVKKILVGKSLISCFINKHIIEQCIKYKFMREMSEYELQALDYGFL